MRNFVKQNIIVHFIIKRLKNNHTFLKNVQTEKAEEPLILTEWEETKTRCFAPMSLLSWIYIYTVLKGTKSLLQAVARENGVNFIDEEKDDENY